MINSLSVHTATAPIRPLYADKTPTLPRRDLNRAWRPEPCPLTRDELRRIVAEQLG